MTSGHQASSGRSVPPYTGRLPENKEKRPAHQKANGPVSIFWLPSSCQRNSNTSEALALYLSKARTETVTGNSYVRSVMRAARCHEWAENSWREGNAGSMHNHLAEP